MDSKQYKSGISGFTESNYISKIAAIEPRVNFHINEIIEICKSISSGLALNNLGMDAKSFIDRAVLGLQNSDDVIVKSNIFGEALATFVDKYKPVYEANLMIKDSLKKVIYHFVSIAELAEDSPLFNLAVIIGGKF